MDRARPPYELYIRYPSLESLWNGLEQWPEGIVLVAGYQAAEICLRLIGDALVDDRPAAFTEHRLERLVSFVAACLDTVHDYLAAESPPQAYCADDSRTDEDWVPTSAFDVDSGILSKLEPRVLARLARVFSVDVLPFNTGIESLIVATCERAGITIQPPDEQLPTIDYGRLVRPHDVSALRSSSPSGPEDHLFRSVHQMTECWLRIADHYVDAATRLADEGSWLAAADRTDRAARAVRRVTEANRLLDVMTLADFLPLSVRLRDASGAQSRAAHRIGAAPRRILCPLAAHLAARSITVAELFAAPENALAEYRLLNCVDALGKNLQLFLFDHYLLAIDVHGAGGGGSLGIQSRQLAEHALRVPLPEIDQARFALAHVMKLRHAATAGTDVTRLDVVTDRQPPPVEQTVERCAVPAMREAVNSYFWHINERRSEGWLDLFDPVSGQLHDIKGSRPYTGRRHLKIFLDTLFDRFPRVSCTHTITSIRDNIVHVRWSFDVDHLLCAGVTFDGQQEFLFDANGKIKCTTTQWDAAELAQDLWSAMRTGASTLIGVDPHD